MEHYVTLFDSLFLPQGMALHTSLERNSDSYTLWVVCVDDAAHDVLRGLALKNVRLLRLADCETDELLRVKPSRTRGEYCWTITPFSPGFVFDADASVGRVTYLDADVWFRRDPQQALQELDKSGKAVLITEHAFAPQYDHSAKAGRFCVQFTTFVRGRADEIRAWWAARCIEWCFARLEDGKFGDQMYLNDWPERFGDLVHVLEAKALLQAPWNAVAYPASEALMYHFHGLRLLRNRQVWLVEGYRIPSATIDAVYRPYLRDLGAALDRLMKLGHPPKAQLHTPALQLRLRELARRIMAPDSHCLAPMVVRA